MKLAWIFLLLSLLMGILIWFFNIRKHELPNCEFYEKIISPGRPVLFLCVDPGCDFCRDELADCKSHAIEFRRVQVIVIADLPVQPKVRNWTFLTDVKKDFIKVFGSAVVPSAYLYDKDNHLIHAWHGAVSAKVILQKIK